MSRKGVKSHVSTKKQEFYRDIDEFTQAQKNMIVEWWPWAMTYWQSYINRFHGCTPDDVLYDGVEEALIYAVRTWDKSKGAGFKTWFHKACSMCVQRSFRRWKKGFLVDEHLDRNIAERGSGSVDRNEDKTAWDFSPYGSTQFEDQALNRIMTDSVMRKLRDNERDIMNSIYVYNEKEADIAKRIGTSRQRVHTVHKRALAKCRKIASELGDIE